MRRNHSNNGVADVSTWLYLLNAANGNYMPLFSIEDPPFVYKVYILNEEKSRYRFYQIERIDCMNQAVLKKEFVIDIPGVKENPKLEVSFKSTDDTKRVEVTVTDYMENIILQDILELDVQCEEEESNVFDRDTVKRNLEEKDKPRQIWPEDISEPIKKEIYGQDKVIDDLADLIVINHMKKVPKLLSVVLLGPTATGKSETAKLLAHTMSELYNGEYGILEIAANELQQEHSMERVFGAPAGYVGHGEKTLLEPCRDKPYIVVFNEIEKANTKVLDGLMEVIDTGILRLADNSVPIDLNKCIFCFTSNIPINMDLYMKSSDFHRSEICKDAFTLHCGRPEIAGKIGKFLAFSPLSDDAVMNIIEKFAKAECENCNLKLKHFEENLMAEFVTQYKSHPTYGARDIRLLVESNIGRYFLRHRDLWSDTVKNITLGGTMENLEIKVQ